VTDVELTWQDGFTGSASGRSGAVRFSHQTEEAKDGKPYRVIVDVLSATHQLGQKNFFELPPVPGNQDSHQPVCRAAGAGGAGVFDMSRECVYQITSDDKGITVSFKDSAGKAFASWSSSSWIAAQQPTSSGRWWPGAVRADGEDRSGCSGGESTTQVNQTINSDRLASLEPAAGQAAPAQGTAVKPASTSSAAVSASAPAKPQPSTAKLPPRRRLRPRRQWLRSARYRCR